MDANFFFNLEGIYELGLSNFDLNQFTDQQKKYLIGLQLLENRKFDSFYSAFTNLNNDAVELNERVFLISWLIVAAEVQFDLNRRQDYLKQLDMLSITEFNLYLEYSKIYFLSITYFYDSQLLLSGVLLDKAHVISQNLKYHRGAARCLYQKALIAKETNRILEKNDLLTACFDICSKHSLQKTKNKAINYLTDQDMLASDLDSNIMNLLTKINDAFLQKDFQYARHLIAKADAQRRTSKIGRKKYSIYLYRIQYLLLTNKLNYARRMLSKITDQVLKAELYTFMIRNEIELGSSEKENLKVINLSLGTADSASNKILNQVTIKRIKNEQLQKLVQTLAKNGSLTKEALFESIYEITYDPIIHDSKLYKLIMKLKKEISTDIIINSYGKYGLNLDKYRFIS